MTASIFPLFIALFLLAQRLPSLCIIQYKGTMVIKTVVVFFLLFVPLTAAAQFRDVGTPRPNPANSADRIRAAVLHSKEPSFMRVASDRNLRRTIPAAFPAGPILTTIPERIKKTPGPESDSILVYSEKDTILQIAHITDDLYQDVTKKNVGGVFVDSQRCTQWQETDNSANGVRSISLNEKWRDDRWVPDTRYTRRDVVSPCLSASELLIEEWTDDRWSPKVRYTSRDASDSGFDVWESRSEHFVNKAWCVVGESNRLSFRQFDRFGNTISTITYSANEDIKPVFEMDTVYGRRTYSVDSTSGAFVADSTLLFSISDLDQRISTKQELLELAARRDRQLQERNVYTRSTDGRSWSEQQDRMVDGAWVFNSSRTVVDSTDDCSLQYKKYYRNDSLFSDCTIIETSPTSWKRTVSQYLNGAWVNQNREATYCTVHDGFFYDTLITAEQWHDGSWVPQTAKRSELDEQGRVHNVTWRRWADSRWVPLDGSIFIFSLDAQTAWYFMANTVMIHRKTDISTGTIEERSPLPHSFELRQNYPNPFNPSTTIGFTLKNAGLTTLKIYNVVGQEVATLVNDVLEAGIYHQKVFDARELASGVYLARLVSGDRTQMKKIVLMK